MNLIKHDGGIWINASKEKPPMNDTRIPMMYDSSPFTAICYKHNSAIWNTDLETWIYEFDFNRLEWLKPIKDVYVFTYDELKDFYNDAMDEGEAEANGDGAATFEQFLESIKQAIEDGWISVEDRLPENDDWVLGFTSFYSKNTFITYYKNRIWGGKDLPVSHWQLLPLPPKK